MLQVFLSLVGKFGASAVWGIVFVYTAEMFPTVIRNQAVGTCSLVARLGGIISMLLDLLKVQFVNIQHSSYKERSVNSFK